MIVKERKIQINGAETDFRCIYFEEGELYSNGMLMAEQLYDTIKYEIMESRHYYLICLTLDQIKVLEDDYKGKVFNEHDWLSEFRRFNRSNIASAEERAKGNPRRNPFFPYKYEPEDWLYGPAIKDDTILNYEILRRWEKANKNKLWKLD